MKIPSYIKSLKPVDHNPFVIPDIQRVVPAIQPQIEIFTSCLMGGEDASRSYNESVSLHLYGNFQKEAMYRALQETVQRHELLRSSFSADGSSIFIQRTGDIKIFFEDLSGHSRDQQTEFINVFKNKEAQTSFDLQNGPLFRVALFKLAEKEHYLTLCVHHIICDGWSLGILMQDLSKFYSAEVKGEKVQWGEAPRFSQYAIEQWEFSQTEAYHKVEKYWIDQYKNSVPVLSVPTDYPRPSVRTYKSRREDFTLDPKLSTAIKKLGAGAGCSYVTTLLTLFKSYLYRLTNQNDIVVGLPAAGQSITENYGLVAHCVNLLPLRTYIPGDDNFLQFLQKEKRVVLDAFDHQQFTFGALLQKLHFVRDSSRIPLVPIIFNVDMGMDNGVAFEGLQHKLVSNPRAYEAFEIFVNVSGSEQLMALEWSFNTQLFKPSTISEMMRGFEELVRMVILDPTIILEEIKLKSPFVSGSELLQFNNTEYSYPKEKPVHRLISEKASEHSTNAAVYYDKQSVSYQQLDETANQLANVLIKEGVKLGDRVGVNIERSHQMVIALLAIMKSGAAYVPLDPEYPKDRIEFMLEDASPEILLTSKKFKGVYHSKAKEIIIEDIWPRLAQYSIKDPEVGVQGNDLVYVMYTSGSTGRPKGVKIAHHNLINFLCSIQKTILIMPTDKVLGLTTLSFDISALEIFLPLVSGASVTIIPGQIARDGNLLLDAIKKLQPTIMQATPATWQMLLEAGWNENLIIHSVCCGGEALTKDLATRLNKRSRTLYNLYGPTETTIWSTVKKVSSQDEMITIGSPIGNTQIYILDNDLLPVSQNATGEIYIAGEGVAKGYLNRPELSDERFVENTFSGKPGDKMYRTGDLGRILSNGEIEYLDRADHQIKIRGYRIEPGEIEYFLKQQPGIKAAIVVAREDRPGDQRLVAYIVPDAVPAEDAGMKWGKIIDLLGYEKNKELKTNSRDDLKVSADQLQKWKQALKQSLPAYMVPNEFLIIEKLPLTPNGKIDRKALPAPGITGRSVKKYAVPRNDLELALVEIWKKLLKVEHVGINDNFFELGGHSLLAMRLITAMRNELSIEVPLIDIFESTIQSLAEKTTNLQHPELFESQRDPGLPPSHLTAFDNYHYAREDFAEWSTDGKYIIPLQKNGTKIPFICILSLNSYRLLANFMSDDQPLYYLPPTQSTSVEVIASHFIKQIKQVQPSGPYFISGFCEAGAIALEIAQRMQAQGDKVSALVLFEYYSSNAALSPLSPKLIKRKLSYYLGRFFKLSLTQSPLAFLKQITQISYGKVRDSYLEPIPPKVITSEEYKNYVCKPYSGKVVLFKAAVPPLEINNAPLMGWSGYFTGDVELVTVEGGHLGIFREPAIEKLAGKLNLILDKINNELSPGTLEDTEYIQNTGYRKIQ